MNISILTSLESNNEWFIYINEVLEKNLVSLDIKLIKFFLEK